MTGRRRWWPAAAALAAAVGAPLLPHALVVSPERIAEGRLIAMGGAKGQDARACFTCHGIDGSGDGVAGVPRMAGQSAWYLYKQLRDYASGARPNPIMSPIARALTIDQMESVAAYYAAAEAPFLPPLDADPALVALGARISEEGIPEREVPSCASCHGPGGVGLFPSFPYLAGQHAGYLAEQLLLWKAEVRENSLLDAMEQISERLDETEIEALAVYFAAQRPGAP